MKITKEKLSVASATLAVAAATGAVVANPSTAHAATVDNNTQTAPQANNTAPAQNDAAPAQQSTSGDAATQDAPQAAPQTDNTASAQNNDAAPAPQTASTDAQASSSDQGQQASATDNSQNQTVDGYMPDSEKQAVTTAQNTKGMTVNNAQTTKIKTTDPNFAKDYAEKDSAKTTAEINQKTSALNQKAAGVDSDNSKAMSNYTQSQKEAEAQYQKDYATYLKEFNNGLNTWSTKAGAKSTSAEGLMKQIDKKMSLGYLSGSGKAEITGSTPKLSAAKKAELNKIGAYTPDLTKGDRELRLVKDGYTWNVKGVGKVNGRDVDAAVTITGLNDEAYAGISPTTIGIDLPTTGIHGKPLQNVDLKVKLTSNGKPVKNTDWLVGIYDLDDMQHASVKNASDLAVGSNVSKSGMNAKSTKDGNRSNDFHDSAIWLVKDTDTINYSFGRDANHKGKNQDWYHRLGFPAAAGFNIPKQPVKPNVDEPQLANAPTDNVTPMNYSYEVAPNDSEVSVGTDQTVTYTGAGDKTPQPVHNADQKVFTRSKITTPDGKSTYTDWQGSKTYDAVKTPVEQGYYADKAEAGAGTPTVDNPHVKDAVNYQPLGHIIPVDENGTPIKDAPTPIYNNDPNDPTKAATTNTPDIDGYTKDQDSVTPTDPGKDTPVVYRKKETPVTPTVTATTPTQDVKAVHVRFQDKNGKNLAPGETLTGEKGSQYTTQPKDIPGYKLVQVPANQNGTYQDVNDDVVYVYEKIDQDTPVKPQDDPAPSKAKDAPAPAASAPAASAPANSAPAASDTPAASTQSESAPASSSQSQQTLPQAGESQDKSSVVAGTAIVGATLAALGASKRKRQN